MDNHRQNYNELNKESNLTPMVIVFILVVVGFSWLFYEFLNYLGA